MTTTPTPQEWNARYKTLPQNIRDVLMDAENPLAERVAIICAHNGLDESTCDGIIRLTAYLLMGFVKPNEYVGEIMEKTDLPREKAALIAQEINRDIFNSLKEDLKSVHGVAEKQPAPVDAMILTPLPGKTPSLEVPKTEENILEQKLGGAFRMKSDAVEYKGVTPPPLAPSTPGTSVSNIPPSLPPTPKPADQYRELPN